MPLKELEGVEDFDIETETVSDWLGKEAKAEIMAVELTEIWVDELE